MMRNVKQQQKSMKRREVLLMLICMLFISQNNGDTSEFPGENVNIEGDAKGIEGDKMEDIDGQATLEDFKFSLNGQGRTKKKRSSDEGKGFTSKQEHVFNQGSSFGRTRSHRNLQAGYNVDQQCPLSEAYVGYVQLSKGNSVEINEVEIRRGDRMQFAVGTHIDGGLNQCIVGKFTSRGDFEAGKYLKTQLNENSECFAMAFIPEVNNIVIAGRTWGYSWALGEWKYAALILIMDQNLNQKVVKIWSYGDDAYSKWYSGAPWAEVRSEARDVAVAEADGSIYVTGYTIGYTHTEYRGDYRQCFVLRLDGQLNKINARSIGSSDHPEWSYGTICNSIQVSRNGDFIYLGGVHQLHQAGFYYGNRPYLFFAKLDANADRVATTTFITSDNYYFALRRIILEKNKGLNESPAIYFCGFIHNQNSWTNNWHYNFFSEADMVIGKLSHTDISSYANDATLNLDIKNAIKIEFMIRYGGPGSPEYQYEDPVESPNYNGDCVLTEDNAYLVGVFSTRHQATNGDELSDPRPWLTNTTVDPFYTPNNNNMNPACDNDQKNPDFLKDAMIDEHKDVGATLTTLATKCEASMKYEGTTYNKDYQNNKYSWRQCSTEYRKNYYQSTCYAGGLIFKNCDTNTWNNDDSHFIQWTLPGIDPLSPNFYSDDCLDPVISLTNPACPATGCFNFNCGPENCNIQRLSNCRAGKNRPLDYDMPPPPGVWMGCFPVNYNSCCQDCSSLVGTYNSYLWWYPSETQCGQWEFRVNVYNKYIFNDATYDPFYFCVQDPTTCSSTLNGINTQILNSDQIWFIYEQDCHADDWWYYTIVTWSMFIFRFDLSKFNAANIKFMPEAAAYFGENKGDTIGQTLAVDEYGYIYVHGRSSSSVFRGSSSRNSWIHVKTHWEMTHEIQDNKVSEIFSEQSPQYLSKRFIRPKKFMNNHGPTFVEMLYDISCGASGWGACKFGYILRNIKMKGWPINEKTYQLSTPGEETGGNYKGHTLTQISDLSSAQKIWGVSYSRMTPVREIRMNTTSTNYNYSIEVPTACIAVETSYTKTASTWETNQKKKIRWQYKNFTFTNPYNYAKNDFLGLTLTGVFTTGTVLSENFLKGMITAPTSRFEGVYYFSIRSGTHYYIHDKNKPLKYGCSLPDYGWFMNHMGLESLRRFEHSLRIKIIVDRADIEPPMLLKGIDEVKAVAGQRYLFQALYTDYFSQCDRMYARSALDTTGPAKHHQLPSWIKFHERNSTFSMYPPQPGLSATVQLGCCNVIEQCAWMSFKVISVNNPPKRVEQFYNQNMETVVIKLDGGVGEAYKWQKRAYEFGDTDKASTATGYQYGADDTKYKSTDHTVFLDFTSTNPYFSSVTSIGLLFGQASTTNAIFDSPPGALSATYQFYDLYTQATADQGSFRILINKLPQLTVQGRDFVFPILDPYASKSSTDFDRYFPFLAKEMHPYEVDTSKWFTNSTSVTYAVNMSDSSSPLPLWVHFNSLTGQLIMDPPLGEPSQILNIKVQAVNQAQGTATVYKQILVNTPPVAVQGYRVMERALLRKVSEDLSTMFMDPNPGDRLEYTMGQKDVKELKAYGLTFEVQNGVPRIFGVPIIPGVIGLVKVRAYDQHGAWAEAFVSIKIDDQRVAIRDDREYQEVEVIERRRFSFKLQEDLFYDKDSGRPLVIYATDMADLSLPDWITFDPTYRSFFGLAPQAGKIVKIKLRAMNQISHDSMTAAFTIYVVATPKPSICFSFFEHDLIVSSGTYFTYTFPYKLIEFDDNLDPQFTVQTSNAVTWPSTFTYHPENRTLTGYNNQPGTYRFDYIFKDALERKVYANIRVYFKAEQPQRVYIHIIASAVIVSAIMIYLGYLCHWLSLSAYYQNRPNQYMREVKLGITGRFGLYKDIVVKYLQVIPFSKLDKAEKDEIAETVTSAVPTIPSLNNNLDTLNSDSTSRPFQLTSRGSALRSSGWGENTVRIGPSKTPNFLGPNEMPSLDEDENPLPNIEEEQEHLDLVIKSKQADNIFEFNS